MIRLSPEFWPLVGWSMALILAAGALEWLLDRVIKRREARAELARRRPQPTEQA